MTAYSTVLVQIKKSNLFLVGDELHLNGIRGLWISEASGLARGSQFSIGLGSNRILAFLQMMLSCLRIMSADLLEDMRQLRSECNARWDEKFDTIVVILEKVGLWIRNELLLQVELCAVKSWWCQYDVNAVQVYEEERTPEGEAVNLTSFLTLI